eukprot:COSAG02_NODE_24589_length_683_cov_1.101027_1_plen_51_part_10
MNTIHGTDVTFVLTSSPPQLRASGEKKLGTSVITLDSTSVITLSQQRAIRW